MSIFHTINAKQFLDKKGFGTLTFILIFQSSVWISEIPTSGNKKFFLPYLEPWSRFLIVQYISKTFVCACATEKQTRIVESGG